MIEVETIVVQNGTLRCQLLLYPDSKFHGANMGTIWGRQDPGGPYVDPMNFVIWVVTVGWLIALSEYLDFQIVSLPLRNKYGWPNAQSGDMFYIVFT